MKKLLAALVLFTGLVFIACQKEYSFENTTDLTSTGAWEFKDSANTLYAGNPIQYYVDDTTDPTSAHMVYTGATANLSGTISIEVFFPTDTAKVGSYRSSLGQVSFLYQGAGKIYKVDAFAGQFSTENITVNLTVVTDTSVTGTFSGTALDSTNRLVTIKEGKFSYKRRSTGSTGNTNISTGSLGTATDTCTGAIVSGTYKKGTAVGTSNTVTVTANVTAAGTYTIYSDTLKGIYFLGTGTFTTTGAQSVVIPAIGTPTDSGTVRFRIRYGTSSCTFLVKIDTASTTVTPTGDYFPITTGSNWSYDGYDSGVTAVADTEFVRSTGVTTTFSGSTFNQFLGFDGISYDTSFYRKASGLYYTVIDLQSLFQSGGIVSNTFLKDNVAQNATWTESYNVTISNLAGTLKTDNVITAKAVSATVGSFTSTDVIKVKTTLSFGVLGVFSPVAVQEAWYARGVGMIYNKQSDPTGSTPYHEQKMRRYYIAP